MKRKFIYASAGIVALSGSLACWTIAQEVAKTQADLSVAGSGAAAGTTISQSSVQGAVTVNSSVVGDEAAVVAVDNVATSGVARAGSPVRSFATTRVVNGDDLKLGGELRKLLAVYSAADSQEKKNSIISQIEGVVNKQFDLRQSARLQELQNLEDQLTKLKDVHAKRASMKEQIVDERVQQVLREAEGLGWGNSEGAPAWSQDSFGYGLSSAPGALPPLSFSTAPGVVPAIVAPTPSATVPSAMPPQFPTRAAPATAPASSASPR